MQFSSGRNLLTFAGRATAECQDFSEIMRDYAGEVTEIADVHTLDILLCASC